MSPDPSLDEVSIEEYEQAAQWRAETLPLLRDALATLTTARDACPTSLEAVKLHRAISAAQDAVSECERNLAVARRMIAREKHQQ